MAVVKAIAAIVVGYLTMFVTIFVSFTVLYLILGPDRTYQPGSYDVTTLWISVTFALGMVAAILGGLVCALIARGPVVPMILAGLVFVFGLLVAVGVLMAPETAPEVRLPGVAMMEAIGKSKQPAYAAFVNAFIGPIGVFVGSRFTSRRSAPPA